MAQNIAVIGCGHWGKNLVRNFAGLGALYAVCDGDADLVQKFADEYGVKAMDFDAVIADPQVEGVVLATPAHTHAALAIQALAHNKHVYIEKPLALSPEDARSMIAKAQQMERCLMVGHLLHYHPAYLKLQALLRDGVLGRVYHIASNRLSTGKLRREENVFWSFAPHDVSMILGLTGEEPNRITAHYHDALQAGIADFATAHMRFPGGVVAQIQTGWFHPFKEQRLIVTGEKGMLVFDDTKGWEEKLVWYHHQADLSGAQPVAVKGEVEAIALEEGEPLRNECRHFIDCVVGKTAPRTDGEEGLRVLRVLHECDRSAGCAVRDAA